MKWFTTWNRPEYKEWARKEKYGYLLLIIRKEPKNYLCVKAKLLMGEKGLPGFEILKEKNFASDEESIKQIEIWKS